MDKKEKHYTRLVIIPNKDISNNSDKDVEYWRERCKDAETEVLRLKGQIQGLEMALRIMRDNVPKVESRVIHHYSFVVKKTRFYKP